MENPKRKHNFMARTKVKFEFRKFIGINSFHIFTIYWGERPDLNYLKGFGFIVFNFLFQWIYE